MNQGMKESRSMTEDRGMKERGNLVGTQSMIESSNLVGAQSMIESSNLVGNQSIQESRNIAWGHLSMQANPIMAGNHGAKKSRSTEIDQVMGLKCGLIGETLKHSFSPMIHQELSDYSYYLISLPKAELANFIQKRFAKQGEYDGLNVTIPYKQAVMSFCDSLSDEAEAIGCINTLVRGQDGRLLGYNTDAFGFMHMARRNGIEFEGKKVLILGSGGTSLTAAYAARKMGAKEVVTVSRSGPVTYENMDRDAQIIVNTTPVGMYPNNGEKLLDLKEFQQCQGVLDVIYNPFYTALLLQAIALGIPCGNGLTMLVAQAKKSAEYFTGIEIDDAEIERIYEVLKSRLTNIVLIGMPGSGKTTIAEALAETLKRQLLDLDAIIEETAGGTIAEIFASEGEDGFRKREMAAAAEAGKHTGAIISTGGGVVLRHENYSALKQNGMIFLLQRDVDRLPLKGARPLSKDVETLKKMFEIRLPLYQRFSDFQIDNNKTLHSAVERILKEIKE